uniref:Galactinol--sucrose galactosyltransferase 6 n=1 Tax=Ananas comosus var. bracteatus TaxID=296719 RepID=A0A6V7PA63_ANACO|nr:unnamed protein product [Ananas comosus var. bracteatus]
MWRRPDWVESQSKLLPLIVASFRGRFCSTGFAQKGVSGSAFAPVERGGGGGGGGGGGRSRSRSRSREMTITPSVRISEGKLVVRGRPILSGVAENAVASSAASHGPVDGVFLGADFARPDSRHVLPLDLSGVYSERIRCRLFESTINSIKLKLRSSLPMLRFKFATFDFWRVSGSNYGGWPRKWESKRVRSLRDTIPIAGIQFGAEEPIYAVFLPLIAGPFRACLQGNSQNQLELCLESGDAGTVAAAFSHALFVGAAGSDPFAAVSGAVAAVKSHLKTFRLRSEKKLPGIVDYFGWCTWDAFYQARCRPRRCRGRPPQPHGRGAPPKFVIIDDGWQSVATDHGEKTHPLPRLTGIKENTKFQNKEDPSAGIESIVRTAKELYGLKYVYVWHAITGYWGGIRPAPRGWRSMDPKCSTQDLPRCHRERAIDGDRRVDDAGARVGEPQECVPVLQRAPRLLASAGIDGVKVDVQCILETLGGGLGAGCSSRGSITKLSTPRSRRGGASVGRLLPARPVSHTIHIASVAYNSVFLGEFMLPDWDMFHSLHPAAEYHASARAISGGPIYHNFELLRKLVLPDGSILRARLPGRPTRDCLFTDPARDGISLLKIWNMNKFAGVVGVYNCQGAAWSSTEKKNVFHHTGAEALTSVVRGNDVHLIAEAAADPDWKGDCAVYSHRSGDLVVLPPEAALPVSLKVLEHDIFAVSPIKELAPGFRFAPLGLIDMFNAGGAVEGLTYHILNGIRLLELDSSFVGAAVNGDSTHSSEISRIESVGIVCIEVRGCGRFGAYSSVKPRKCTVGSVEVEFSYDSASGLLVLQLDSMPKERVHKVVVELEVGVHVIGLAWERKGWVICSGVNCCCMISCYLHSY